MPSRPKHPNKDLEKLIRELEGHDWSVTKRKKYYSARCPCGVHSHMIALSPSGGYYVNHWRQWLAHQTCWKGEGT